jgi:hypothetical protein
MLTGTSEKGAERSPWYWEGTCDAREGGSTEEMAKLSSERRLYDAVPLTAG